MAKLPQTVYGPIEELRSGVDWISCTLHAEANERWVWANKCVEVILEVAKDGYDVRDAGLMGYRGILAGGCFAGDRDDGSYLQLSGAYAQTHLARVLRSDLHVSRLDLAVTCRFVVMPTALGSDAYQAASKAVGSSIDGQRRRKVYNMSGTDGGYTVYIGAPSSTQRGRLYNKEVQSDTPDYERCWRWEVVFKNALAMEVLRALSALQAFKIPTYCAMVVREWYVLRGVQAPWSSVTDDFALPVTKTKPSDATKKLVWLESQVRPAFRWLIEHGYQNEAFYALGMDHAAIEGLSRNVYKVEE